MSCIYETYRRQFQTTQSHPKAGQHFQRPSSEASTGSAFEPTPKPNATSPVTAWRSDTATVSQMDVDSFAPTGSTDGLYDLLLGPGMSSGDTMDFGFGLNLEWVTDGSKAFWPASPSEEMQLFEQTVTAAPELHHQEDMHPVMPKVIQPFEVSIDSSKDDATLEYLPTPDQPDIPSPTDPWPMDRQAGPAQRLVLPSLGGSVGFHRQRNHFSTPTVSSTLWTALRRFAQLPSEQNLWPEVDMDGFPDRDTIDHCIDLYFVHVHQVSSTAGVRQPYQV